MSVDELFTPPELAERLKIPLPILYRWNHTGTGPPLIRLGVHVRYRSSDVDRWLDQRAKNSKAS